MAKLETKVVAIDVYGTMIATNDPDNELPPRIGLAEFLEDCKQKGLILCTCSDGTNTTVKINLKDSGVNLEYFDCFFEMERGLPKKFEIILEHYKIKPKQLLVIGDNWERDIKPAEKLGCHWAHLKEYFDIQDYDKLDMRKIIIQ